MKILKKKGGGSTEKGGGGNEIHALCACVLWLFLIHHFLSYHFVFVLAPIDVPCVVFMICW